MKYLEFDVYRAAIAVSVSFALHLALLAWVHPGLPGEHPAAQTLEIVLSQAAPSQAQSNGSGPVPKDTPVSTDSPAWSGQRTQHSNFSRRTPRGADNLSWMEDYFSGQPVPSSGAPPETTAQPARDTIREVLASAPTTGSTYWQFLVRHLANSRYFDKQYRFSELDRERTVVLELKISPNGFMERARVRLSSGDEALDAAAIRSAYAANPFRPPPAEDAASGYLYLVKITYTPEASTSGG
ncbi:MAG: TonB family protein [Gammaproteobacteria bacterium]|nr:MAG: TonB family protein [Gammaproteobacteria bacterium]